MVFLLCSALTIIILSCAVVDARTYRIPDILTALLFLGSLGAPFLPGWSILPRDAFFGFLFIFPIIFMMWSGSSLPSGLSDFPTTNVEDIDEPWTVRDLLQFALPSVLSWVALLIVGGLLVDRLLWFALPVGLICAVGVFAKGWRKAPWANTKFSSSWLGGGDMKMLGGCILLVGISGLQIFSLSLAVLNVVLIVFLRIKRRDRDHTVWENKRIPMGIAIAGAAMFVLILRNVGLAN